MSSGGSASARRRRASTWWVVGGIIVLAAAGIVWLQQGPSISAGSREDISARHVRLWMQRLSGGDVKHLTECTGYSSPKRLARRAKGSLRGAAREVNGIHVRRMQRKVEAVRKLTFKRPIKTRFLSPEDFVYRYADPMLGGMVQAGFMVQERLLVTLGVMYSGIDLQRLSHGATSKGLAGLYMPATKRLFVRSAKDGTLRPYEEVVLSHELDHALEDQRLGLPDIAGADQDAQLAARAIAEGSATLTMHRYAARYLSPREQISVLRIKRRPHAPTGNLDRLPPFVRSGGAFPYVDGLRYLCGRYLQGGWKAVNAALRNPPETTAAILYPSWPSQREALTPHPPGTLPARWWKALDTSFGAAELSWLFEAPSGDPRRVLDHHFERAAAWSGGRIHLWMARRRTALALVLLQRDTRYDLCKSMKKWYEASFPGTHRAARRHGEVLAQRGPLHDAVLSCEGPNVRLGIAPTLDIARAVTS